uniref:Uncharacterized protein n=1 Tax=Arundo donax TaxID=35708 RepID=A0A0A8ZTS9_ARUDO
MKGYFQMEFTFVSKYGDSNQSLSKEFSVAVENSRGNQDFLMVYRKRAILTKDNLAKRNWNRSQKCCFLITRKFSTFS